MPLAPIATDNEVLTLIEERRLYSRGIGYLDAHLVASAMLTNELVLWTRDKRLRAVVDELEIGVGWV